MEIPLLSLGLAAIAMILALGAFHLNRRTDQEEKPGNSKELGP